MSRVIRSTKIDEGFFPLIIEAIAPDIFSSDSNFEEENSPVKNSDKIKTASEEILMASHEQARQIVSAAKQQSNDILKQAKNQGYKEGLAQGREEGLAQIQAEGEEKLQRIHSEVKNLIKQAENIRVQLLGGAEEEVVELAMTIASKVIRNHVKVKRDTVVQLAAEALERAISAGFYTIFVNPDDVELLREFISELRRSASGGARIHIISDGSISQGGCKVETVHGLVDMTLESQLEQIRKALREELERNGQYGGAENERP